MIAFERGMCSVIGAHMAVCIRQELGASADVTVVSGYHLDFRLLKKWVLSALQVQRVLAS